MFYIGQERQQKKPNTFVFVLLFYINYYTHVNTQSSLLNDQKQL